MKNRCHIKPALGVLIFAATVSLQAQVVISNTNNVNWAGPQSDVVNLGPGGNTAAPYDALGLTITVDAGSQLNLDSISLYLSSSGGGSGNTASPYVAITDSSDDNLGTSPSVTLNTTFAGLHYDVTSYAEAAAYLTTFTLSSPVSLTAGTYNLNIWDTGEQLNYYTAGEVENSGVSITIETPFNTPGYTPAFNIAGSIVATPEPSTFALAAVGSVAMGIAVLRRRISKTK